MRSIPSITSDFFFFCSQVIELYTGLDCSQIICLFEKHRLMFLEENGIKCHLMLNATQLLGAFSTNTLKTNDTRVTNTIESVLRVKLVSSNIHTEKLKFS